MIIASSRLELAPFYEPDFERFYSVFSNDQVMHYALMDFFASPEASRPYFSQILHNNQMTGQDRDAYEFAVYIKGTHTFIGYADIGRSIYNTTGGIGEIGYFLLPPFWGNGYAAEIAQAVCRFGFKKLELHKIIARCNINNTGSERTMQKIGMTKEAHLRKARFKHGEWVDELQYGLLSSEISP